MSVYEIERGRRRRRRSTGGSGQQGLAERGSSSSSRKSTRIALCLAVTSRVRLARARNYGPRVSPKSRTFPARRVEKRQQQQQQQPREREEISVKTATRALRQTKRAKETSELRWDILRGEVKERKRRSSSSSGSAACCRIVKLALITAGNYPAVIRRVIPSPRTFCVYTTFALFSLLLVQRKGLGFFFSPPFFYCKRSDSRLVKMPFPRITYA